MLFFEPHLRDKAVLPHDPIKALVSPRPIGWVSTMSAEGATNLAPFSFFGIASMMPPMISFCSNAGKDSVTFAEQTGEFVWNLVTEELQTQMNDSSTRLPAGESEFAYAGVEMAPCRMVRAPRVARSPGALECKVVDVFRLRDMGGQHTEMLMVVGQIVGVHLDPSFVEDGRVMTAKMRPLSRLGYWDYAVVDEVFEIAPPKGVMRTTFPG